MIESLEEKSTGREDIHHFIEENSKLKAMLNSPEVLNFLEGVRREVAHQREKWGAIADRDKSAENWFWLVGYLASKALRAHIEGHKEKALHHTISAAAALANWHDFILHDRSGRGVAQDLDLKKIQQEMA